MNAKVHPMRDDKMCRLTRHILSPQIVCTSAAHFVARRQIVHGGMGGDNMCRQHRHNLSPVTNCAGATKCAVTGQASNRQTIIEMTGIKSGIENFVISTYKYVIWKNRNIAKLRPISKNTIYNVLERMISFYIRFIFKP